MIPISLIYRRLYHRLIGRKMSTYFYEPQLQFLGLSDGRRLAYQKIEGLPSHPTIIYVPGFTNGKDGEKPKRLVEFCKSMQYSFIRYDPICIGDSLGDWSTLEFEDWVESAATILEQVGSEKNIVIGSSMGGWISSWLATQPRYKDKIESLILIAPAVNFMRPFYASIVEQLPEEAKDILDRGEIYQIQDEFGTKPMKKSVAESSAKYELDLQNPIDIECPVRIFHGLADDTISYNCSAFLMEKIKSNDVELTFIKTSGHRFDDTKSMSLIEDSILKLAEA